VFLISLGLLFAYKPVDDWGYHKIGSLLRESGAVLLASVALVVLWDLVGKKAFTDEILAKANMSRDLAEAGIEVVSDTFQNERVAWAELFRCACKLDIFISYGHTWRNTQLERIDKMLSDPDSRVRVVLPDPDDPEIVSALSTRYATQPEDMKQEIFRARAFFQYRKSKAKGTVEIYFARIVPLFSFYRFNNKVVFALYNHRQGRMAVPTFIVNEDGFLFKYFTDEFEGIIGNKDRTRRADSDKTTETKKQSDPRQLEAAELKPAGPEDETTPLLGGDLPKRFLDAAREQQTVAWDIETSGLDWRSERIGLCTVWVNGQGLGIVKIIKNTKPTNLAALLVDPSIRKIFHHAMFDLRFMCYHWGVSAANIACTKIASKLIDPSRTQGHTLSALLQQYLGVSIDKSQRKSDWLTWALSQDQLAYAGADVVHLPNLLAALTRELDERKLSSLAAECFAHIPTQVQLDIRGYKDIFGY